MPNNDTLLAYLVPRLTRQVENAATDALGYILNKSTRSMQALNDLLRGDGFDIEPIVNVETQVTYEDGSRPDIAGYDRNDVKRLLVEAKFWAALLEGQASGYVRQFDHCGPSVLLFIAPELRIPTLWTEIRRQMQGQLEWIDAQSGVHTAGVIGTKRRVMLVSWARLLDSMAALAEDPGIEADVRQLRGLAQRQDVEAFLPLDAQELSPDYPRRVVQYNQIADDAVDSRGVPEGWMTTKGLRATPQQYGYGRYFRFPQVPADIWFGVNHQMWAGRADTPLWLWVSSHPNIKMDEIGKELGVQVHGQWVPLHLKSAWNILQFWTTWYRS